MLSMPPSQPECEAASHFFPVTHAILSAEALLEQVLPAYDLGRPLLCRFLQPGVNDSYLVQTETLRAVLRVYRAGWRTAAEIQDELDALLHLHRKGVAVSIPLARRDGRLLQTLPAPEGPRHAALFTYAPGKPLDRQNAEHVARHGRALAHIHAASDDVRGQTPRRAIDLGALIERPLEWARPFLADRPADWEMLLSVSRRVRKKLKRCIEREPGLEWGFCHGDGHVLNAHLDEDGTETVFDFDFCGPGWRAYDLAIVRWSEAFYGKDQDDRLWQAFLGGYQAERSLAEADLAAIPAFVMARELWHLGLEAITDANLGYSDFERYVDRTMRLLAAWEARYPLE